MSKEIPLTQGKVAIVDDEDYEWLSEWKWHAHIKGRHNQACYAAHWYTKDGHRDYIQMANLVMGIPLRGGVVDHINHNGLDNRRANLRICTRAQNVRNCRRYKNNTSGHMGVYWDTERDQWRSVIVCDGVHHHLGRFDAPEQAARAYDAAALELHGEFATLNFPEAN